MAKNSNKQQKKKQKKDQSVFKVAGARVKKSKNKPKPVTSNLKNINAQTRNEISVADGKFGDLKDALLKTKKPQSGQEMKMKPAAKISAPAVEPDMEGALEQLTKL